MAATAESSIDTIETTVQKTNRWIDELSHELGVSRHQGYRVLRAFLHTIRDRLVVDETAHLSAQLPMLVRGLYFEGWDPSKTPVKMKGEEFIEIFAARAILPDDLTPEVALKTSAQVMRRHVTEGEVEDVLHMLPAEVRRLLG